MPTPKSEAIKQFQQGAAIDVNAYPQGTPAHAQFEKSFAELFRQEAINDTQLKVPPKKAKPGE